MAKRVIAPRRRRRAAARPSSEAGSCQPRRDRDEYPLPAFAFGLRREWGAGKVNDPKTWNDHESGTGRRRTRPWQVTQAPSRTSSDVRTVVPWGCPASRRQRGHHGDCYLQTNLPCGENEATAPAFIPNWGERGQASTTFFVSTQCKQTPSWNYVCWLESQLDQWRSRRSKYFKRSPEPNPQQVATPE